MRITETECYRILTDKPQESVELQLLKGDVREITVPDDAYGVEILRCTRYLGSTDGHPTLVDRDYTPIRRILLASGRMATHEVDSDLKVRLIKAGLVHEDWFKHRDCDYAVTRAGFIAIRKGDTLLNPWKR